MKPQTQTGDGASRWSVGRLVRALYEPVDNASLTLFRIVFGAILAWEIYRYYENNWIKGVFIDPEFHFKYLGFGWVEPLPGDGMFVLFALLGVAGIGIALGLFYRLCVLFYGVGWLYIFLLEEAKYLNHYYMVILLCLLMSTMPLNRAWSIDALMNPYIRSRTAPAWSLWLMRAQVGIVYFYAGVAKLKWDWLMGRPTLLMWTSWAHDKPVVSEFPPALMAYFLSYGGLLLDLFVVPFLLWRKTRWLAFGAALFFHSSNKLLFAIGIFPYFMTAATTLFFDPDWPRRVWAKIRPGVSRAKREETGAPQLKGPVTLTPQRRMWAAILGVYLVIQLLLPLRHYLYPGTVLWTEEGQYFAWHMLLRSKRYKARFWVVDPTTDAVKWVDPLKYLPQWQARSFAKRPDRIVQFAHYLEERLERRGMHNQAIHAEVYVSLNRRDFQLLIDPDVDLTEVKRSLWPRPYILPLTEPLPPMSEAVKEIRDSLSDDDEETEEETGSGPGKVLKSESGRDTE